MNPAVSSQIEQILSQSLQATLVQVEDESHRHAGHRGRQDPLSQGGHFNVQVVSPQFAAKPLLQRHRLVYTALDKLMGREIHALSIHAHTPEEWQQRSERD
ncbi:MAG: BolA family transcriptional regulator [Synechococcaceae cyanobacterium SM2_3_1]|nr:BolA family transcriptional regulator [Synechococcaceae cyanobacterium SM2_3_1]